MISSLGINRGYNIGRTIRVIFCLTTKDDGSANRILKSYLTAVANLQALFQVPDFATDTSSRMVCTPQIKEFADAPTEPEFWEVEDHKEEVIAARADVSFSMINISPYIAKYMQDYKNNNLSYYELTDLNFIEGIDDGLYLKPKPIQSGSFATVQYGKRSYNAGSKTLVSFRRQTGVDINLVQAVAIADASVTDDSAFWSMIPATATYVNATAAVTGCAFDVVCDDPIPSTPSTAINVTGHVFGDISFVNTLTGVAITLAGAGSISQTGARVTVNESALLTSGQSYYVHDNHAKHNIPRFTITIP
jgi:hypothetical protein